MFDPSTRYVTQGIVHTVPRPTQNLLWLLLERMSVGRRDALQVFHLKAESDKQSVMHTQENPYSTARRPSPPKSTSQLSVSYDTGFELRIEFD